MNDQEFKTKVISLLSLIIHALFWMNGVSNKEKLWAELKELEKTAEK